MGYPRMGGGGEGRGCNPRELDSVERTWVGNRPQGGKFDSAAILESEGRQNETCFCPSELKQYLHKVSF